MNPRRVLAEWLADKLDVPVAATPLDPVHAPGLVLGPGATYRTAETACGWTAGVEVTVVAGQMGDDGNVYDLCDELVDQTLDALEVYGANVAAVAQPAVQTIGNVAHLAAVIQANLP